MDRKLLRPRKRSEPRLPLPSTGGSGYVDNEIDNRGYGFHEKEQEKEKQKEKGNQERNNQIERVENDGENEQQKDQEKEKNMHMNVNMNMGPSSPPSFQISRSRLSDYSSSYNRQPSSIRITNENGTYQLGQELGRGGFGAVYQALNVDTGDFVAVKRIEITSSASTPASVSSRKKISPSISTPLSSSMTIDKNEQKNSPTTDNEEKYYNSSNKVLSAVSEDHLVGIPMVQLTSIQSEIDLLKKLDHPHIVNYIDFIRTTHHFHIILEFMENGSLATVVKKFGCFSESLAGMYMYQVLLGLEYLHEQGVLHRDIKGANILTTKDGIVKLADFGVALKLNSNNLSSSSSSSPTSISSMNSNKNETIPKLEDDENYSGEEINKQNTRNDDLNLTHRNSEDNKYFFTTRRTSFQDHLRERSNSYSKSTRKEQDKKNEGNRYQSKELELENNIGNEIDVVGSPFWMAPEIIEMSSTPTSACDIWSLGCTIVELLTGKPPYFDLPPMAALFRIVQDDNPPFPENISENLNDFLLLCFKKEPLLRKSASNLLKHDWLQSFHKNGNLVNNTNQRNSMNEEESLSLDIKRKDQTEANGDLDLTIDSKSKYITEEEKGKDLENENREVETDPFFTTTSLATQKLLLHSFSNTSSTPTASPANKNLDFKNIQGLENDIDEEEVEEYLPRDFSDENIKEHTGKEGNKLQYPPHPHIKNHIEKNDQEFETEFDNELDKDLHFANSLQLKQELHNFNKEIINHINVINVSLQKYDFHSGFYLQILDSWWRKQFLQMFDDFNYRERQEEITKLIHQIEIETSLIVKKCSDIDLVITKYPNLAKLYIRQYGVLPFIELLRLDLNIPAAIESCDRNLDEYLEFYRNAIQSISVEEKERIALNTQVFLHNRYTLKNKIKTSLIKSAWSCLSIVNKITSIELLKNKKFLSDKSFEELDLATTLVINDYSHLTSKTIDSSILLKDSSFLNKLCILSFIPMLLKYIQLGISQTQMKCQFEAVLQSEMNLSSFLPKFLSLTEENMDGTTSLNIIPLTIEGISICPYSKRVLPYQSTETEEQNIKESLNLLEQDRKKPHRSSNLVSFFGGLTGTLLTEKEKEKNKIIISHEKETSTKDKKRVAFEDQSLIKTANDKSKNIFDSNRQLDLNRNSNIGTESNFNVVKNQHHGDRDSPSEFSTSITSSTKRAYYHNLSPSLFTLKFLKTSLDTIYLMSLQPSQTFQMFIACDGLKFVLQVLFFSLIVNGDIIINKRNMGMFTNDLRHSKANKERKENHIISDGIEISQNNIPDIGLTTNLKLQVICLTILNQVFTNAVDYEKRDLVNLLCKYDTISLLSSILWSRYHAIFWSIDYQGDNFDSLVFDPNGNHEGNANWFCIQKCVSLFTYFGSINDFGSSYILLQSPFSNYSMTDLSIWPFFGMKNGTEGKLVQKNFNEGIDVSSTCLNSTTFTSIRQCMKNTRLLRILLDILTPKEKRLLTSPSYSSVCTTICEIIINISTQEEILEALDRAGAIPSLVPLLDLNGDKLENLAIKCLYNLTRVNKKRLEKAVKAGIIPFLQESYISKSYMKETILTILCEIPHSSDLGRTIFMRANGIQFLLELLKESEWRVQALSSLSTLLSHDEKTVEKMIRSSPFTTINTTRQFTSLVQSCSEDTFEQIVGLLLDMLVTSKFLREMMLEKEANVFISSLLTKLRTTKKAFVKKSILLLIKIFYNHLGQCSRQDRQKEFIEEYQLISILTQIKSESSNQVLVRDLTSQLMKDFTRLIGNQDEIDVTFK